MVLRLILSRLFDDGLRPAEVGISRRDVFQGLVPALDLTLCLGMEAVHRFDHDIGGAGDQIMSLE